MLWTTGWSKLKVSFYYFIVKITILFIKGDFKKYDKQNSLKSFPQKMLDPRRWYSGVQQTVDLTFQVPRDLTAGMYDVILNLPDAAATLAQNPKYRILMNNGAGVGEVGTRYNILFKVVVLI